MDKNKSRNVENIIAGLFVIVGIVFFVIMSIVMSNFKTTYAENNVLIGDLTEQLTALNQSAENVDTDEVSSTKLASCADLGTKVAELQTAYQRLDIIADESGWMDNVYALDACFAENDKNARVPWFSVLTEYNVIWKWEFQSTYSFASKTIDVVWLCRDANNGDLLAYATGVYDIESALFSNVKYNFTSIGMSYQHSSVDDSGGIDSDINATVSADSGSSESATHGNFVDDSGQPEGIGSGGVGPDVHDGQS